MGVECLHIKLKYINCGENHRANSQTCVIWERQQTSPAKSNIVMKNNPDFAIVISNK